MGGGGKKQRAANLQQAYANQENSKIMKRSAVDNEIKMRGTQYKGLFAEQVGGARRKAEQAVTDERTRGIADSSALLENYNKQERRRFMQSKKGQGQVSAADNAISAKDSEAAKSMLNRGSDYWEARRGAAGNAALSKAKDEFLAKYGSEATYANSGSTKLEYDDHARKVQEARAWEAARGWPSR